MHKIYLDNKNGRHTFKNKPTELQELINEAIFIAESFGVPINDTPRRLERMALCVLALADVKGSSEWRNMKDIQNGISMRSRDIIEYVNKNFGENMSSGSYDDIRRKDLKLLVLAGIVLQTRPEANPNDSTRGYAISHEHAELMRKFGEQGWEDAAQRFMENRENLSEMLESPRKVNRAPIESLDGIEFSPGVHNELQMAVLKKFLPMFGPSVELLYLGDAKKRMLLIERDKLKELRFFELSNRKLPDIVVYLPEKNWIFLIEVVNTGGYLSRAKVLEFKELTKDCTADIIYVSVFKDRESFKRHSGDIAWETEVWIAENPDHMIHYNGEKFLGPIKNEF